MCPNGKCTSDFSLCSDSRYLCELEHFSRCADGVCRLDCSGIATNGCPAEQPFFCPTGKCAKSILECTGELTRLPLFPATAVPVREPGLRGHSGRLPVQRGVPDDCRGGGASGGGGGEQPPRGGQSVQPDGRQQGAGLGAVQPQQPLLQPLHGGLRRVVGEPGDGHPGAVQDGAGSSVPGDPVRPPLRRLRPREREADHAAVHEVGGRPGAVRVHPVPRGQAVRRRLRVQPLRDRPPRPLALLQQGGQLPECPADSRGEAAAAGRRGADPGRGRPVELLLPGQLQHGNAHVELRFPEHPDRFGDPR